MITDKVNPNPLFDGEKMSLQNRVSKLYEVVPVYAVGAVILYTWALVNTMSDFSKNWILYLTAVEVAAEFAYILLGVFLESLLIIVVLLLARFLLPQKILEGRFIMYGSLLVTAFLGWLMFRDEITVGLGGSYAWAWRIFIVGAALVLAVLGERIKNVRSAIESVADRCVVFLYVYLPLSFISLIVIIFRNIG